MSAIISPCGAYRYRLERGDPTMFATAVIMVNPSTADAETDDATIRKLLGFFERKNLGRLIVGNLFAYRATDVKELATAPDPVGPQNDYHLERIMQDAMRVIFAWGPASKLPKRLRTRWRRAWEIARCYDLEPDSIGPPARDGQPCHPLMLPYSTELQPWRPAL